MIIRKGLAILFICFVSGTFSIAHEVWSLPLSESDIRMLVDEVDSKNLLDTLSYLTSFNSRASYEVQEEVIGFIGNELEEAGATVRLHEYNYDGRTWHNLVAIIPGNASLDPSEPHLIVGAHIDTVSFCPGADDNASGVSAIMEAGRVLASSALPVRVDFVFFTLEEKGITGSSNYTADAKTSGEVIKAMIAVDMIGFEFPGGDLELVTKPSMAWIAQDYKEAADNYTSLDTVLVIQDSCG